MAAEYEVSVEQVHRAFSDEHYWLARLADSGADDATLDSMVIGDDGGAMDVDLARTLPSVRHRLESVGGRIEVEARDGAGSGPSGNTVRVFVPKSAAGSA